MGMCIQKITATLITALLAVVLWGEALYLSSDTVLFAWDAVESAETYEVKAIWDGRSGVRGEFNLGSTEDTQFLVSRPRVGFFILAVRALNSAGESPWSLSSDPDKARVDGLPRGWRVFFELSAPSGGGIA